MAVPSYLEKVVDLLFYLSRSGEPVGVSRVASDLKVPKTSAHRMLQALTYRGMVTQRPDASYELGIGVAALALGVRHPDALARAAQAELRRGAEQSGETLFLVAEEAGELLVVSKAEGRGFLRVSPTVGAQVPVHATAVGRIYLAYAPERVHCDEAQLLAYTPHTLATPTALRSDVARVAQSGIAHSHEEWMPGLSTLAVPVWLEGRLASALVLACVAQRMQELNITEIAGMLQEISRRITLRLEKRS